MENLTTVIAGSQTLSEFLLTTGLLSEEDMVLIVNQALVLIDELYAHLPLKKAMHGIDPVQKLKLLKRRVKGVTERSFHNEMISIFTSLRDLHTNYLLPDPYRDKIAFLPFLIEEYFDSNKRRYIITKIHRSIIHDTFKAGVEITHWSGIPIDTAISNISDREAGSNEFARHVRGLDRMTIRPMRMSLPPDEEWVIASYTDGTDNFEIRLPWQVTDQFDIRLFTSALDEQEDHKFLVSQGIDLLTDITNRVKKNLFSPESMEIERRVNHLRSNGNATPSIIRESLGNISILPETFEFRVVNSQNSQFGYVRIRSFTPNPDSFIPEFIRIISLLPQDGLILDVRGNGGGIIMNGERMLQLLTSNRVIAENLEFINTEQTLRLSKTERYGGFLKRWRPSIEAALFTGAIYSQGFPIEDSNITNAIGQKYTGKVVLITDARCYSTTDIFAAGFQDNKIGIILGVDGNTGAGGANVFTHDLLNDLFGGLTDSPIKPLPHGANMRVAIRRTIRVNDNVGMPVEDMGVIPDKIHKITRNDLLQGNIDMINTAAKILTNGL